MLERTDLLLVQRIEGVDSGTFTVEVESLEEALQLLWKYSGMASPDSDAGIYEPADVDDASEGVVNDFDEALRDDDQDLIVENTYVPAVFFEPAVEDGCVITPVLDECGISGGIFA